TQITAVDPDVCRACVHKPCLHGRYTKPSEPAGLELPLAGATAGFVPGSEVISPNGDGFFPGCETDLFVPTITSNMDCTLCLNCVRSCPYDNVALTVRAPGRELHHDPWARRGRLAAVMMGVLLTFFGIMNALAMIPPFFDAAERLADLLGTRNEAILLLFLYGGVTLAGLGLTVLATTAADALGGVKVNVRKALERWGYVVLALGVGFWAAHYTFHFLTGALSIVPVFQLFFEFRGFAVDRNWRLAQVVPSAYLCGIQATSSGLAGVLALYTTARIGLRD